MTGYITASPPVRPDELVLIPGDPERIADGVPIDPRLGARSSPRPTLSTP